MKFSFSRRGLRGRERLLERFFEILPGATSWTILLGMTALSFWRPLTAALLVIAFDLYWLMRLFYMTIFLAASYGRLAAESRIDWMKRLRQSGLPWERVAHLVIFPIMKETREILEPGIRSLVGQSFPSERILVVLAVEQRSEEEIRQAAQALQQQYRERFLDFLVVLHPDGLPGEARVKGANATYAAKEAEKFLHRRKIELEDVVASCFDADTVVSPNYFGGLTWHFLTCPDRDRASFQPIPVYHNNIWEAPGFARVLDIGSSFFQLIEATNPERLVTFSSHSVSFKALKEVGYWPVDLISDDSAIYWKSLIHFDGDYRVVPMYVTLSMDVTHSGGWWRTAVNVYRQKRRWAWGVENFPLVMRAFLRARRIPLLKRVRAAFRLFEGQVSWATWGLLLAVIGWLPILFAGSRFSDTVLYYSAPRITQTIFRLSGLCLITTIFLSMLLLPKRKVRHPIRKRIGHALEWLLVPLIAVFFSTLPALDAQTRLMRARHMEFWVTEKKRG